MGMTNSNISCIEMHGDMSLPRGVSETNSNISCIEIIINTVLIVAVIRLTVT